MDRYRLSRLLGAGGMAVVYAGTRRLADGREQPVALKLLRPEHGREAGARLGMEAAAGLALHHHNLVRVYDFDMARQQPCIVMEHVNGVSLHELAQHGGLSPEVVRKIVINVLEALEYVHGRGVLHRDISPGNILISRQGKVKLADLGLARVMGEPITAPGFKGTPAYASPEALGGQELEPSADLYSLAAVVYELLMGTPPHGAGTVEEIRQRHDPGSGWRVTPLPADTPIDLRVFITALLCPVEERAITRAADAQDCLAHLIAEHRGELSVASDVALGELVEAIVAARSAGEPAVGERAGTDGSPAQSKDDKKRSAPGGRDAEAPGGHAARPHATRRRGLLALAALVVVLLAISEGTASLWLRSTEAPRSIATQPARTQEPDRESSVVECVAPAAAAPDKVIRASNRKSGPGGKRHGEPFWYVAPLGDELPGRIR